MNEREEKLPTQIVFRIDERLAAKIADRAERHGGVNFAARIHLERYYYLLAAELRTLRGRFGLGELGLLADVANGWLVEPHTIPSLHYLAEDGIALDRLDTKWQLEDPAGLIEKLRGLSYGQAAALVDALERWWAQPAPAASAEGFAAVGLVPAAADGRAKNPE